MSLKQSPYLKRKDHIKDRHLSGSNLYVVRLRGKKPKTASVVSSVPVPSIKAQSKLNLRQGIQTIKRAGYLNHQKSHYMTSYP